MTTNGDVYPSGLRLPKVFKDFYRVGNRLLPVYYTDRELHAYLRRERGDRWYEEPWAKVWLGVQRYRPIRYRKRKIPRRTIHLPNDLVDSLILLYLDKGLKPRSIAKVVKYKHRAPLGFRSILRRIAILRHVRSSYES